MRYERFRFSLATALVAGSALAAPAAGAPRRAPAEKPVETAVEVVFENDRAGVKLAGTLTLPASARPCPAVLLVTGSGPQDRDETVLSHKPFLAIAEHLARRGFAVLRYDDRGVGGSTGDFLSATTEDFAGDAAAGLAFLRGRPEVDPKRVGILGHSEGALIASMVAAGSKDVAFVVMLGGSGIPGDALLHLQGERLLRASGLPESAVAANRELQRVMFGVMRSEPDPAAGGVRLRRELVAAASAMSEADQRATGVTPAAAEMHARMAEKGYRWMRFFVGYDPATSLRRVSCPVLALGGGMDLQVPAAENLAAIEEALRAGGNTRVTAASLPNHNHLFQECETGLPAEYATIGHPISQRALDLIADWLAGAAAR